MDGENQLKEKFKILKAGWDKNPFTQVSFLGYCVQGFYTQSFTFNAQGLKIIIIVAQVWIMKIYLR